MALCAVRGCLEPATETVTRDGTSRLACAAHAREARELGYQATDQTAALQAVKLAADRRNATGHGYRQAIRLARSAGATWEAIGQAAGMTRQAVKHTYDTQPKG